MADKDEDFEEEEINYKRMCRDIIGSLNKIKGNFGIFDKFKMPDSKKKDIMEIKVRLEKLNYHEYNSQVFAELMDTSCQIEDLLEEIDFAFKNLLKKMNNPSESDKREIYSYFRIEKITPQLRKLSNEFDLKLSKISELIKKIMDKYLAYYKEE